MAFTKENLNYAQQYSQALDQEFPYSLYFGALYQSPSNSIYKIEGADTIKIPHLSTSGRVDGDADSIDSVVRKRRFNNKWIPKVLTNHRVWETPVHPTQIDRTNYVASIQNITQVFNQEQKFPEMDAYCVSKIYNDWRELGKVADTTILTEENVLKTFDSLMKRMTKKRVPTNGRILYVTADVEEMIKNAKQISRTMDVTTGNSNINRIVNSIDLVSIVVVPNELMCTSYNFDEGYEIGTTAKQINMLLIYPSAVLTPVNYTFAQLDPPSAGTQGKYEYFEESFEDVFVLDYKKDAIAFNVGSIADYE